LRQQHFCITKKKIKKRGRPPLPKNKTRDVFSLRFSRDELAEMNRAAKQADQGVREWARNCLLAAAGHDNP